MTRVLVSVAVGLLVSMSQLAAQNGQGANALQTQRLPAETSAAGPIYTVGNGIQAPTVIQKVRAAYTPQALREKISGTVELDVVVTPDGSVQDVRVLKSLDLGLDQEAINAARQWLFKPGTKDGKPVPVRVVLVLEFKPESQTSAQSAADEACFKDAHHWTESGLTQPVVKTRVESLYTRAAMQAKLQGDVWLEVVVSADGTVGCARVTQSLDKQYGLDEEALKAARQWTFAPARLNGQPVPVLVVLQIVFRLH